MINHREVLRLHSLKLTQENIAASVPCARASVSRTLKRAREEGLTWEAARVMTDAEVTERLYPSGHTGEELVQRESRYLEPDYEWIQKEYMKPGVTIQMLWSGYAERAQDAEKQGDVMNVEWIGTPVFYTDRVTGSPVPCYVFVAVLPFSGYMFAEAMASMTRENWIQGHVDAFVFYGGVPKIVAPDNFWPSAACIECGSAGPNHDYARLAEYYGTAVVPVQHHNTPQARACIERAARNLNANVLTLLRTAQLFSLCDLNTAICDGVKTINLQPLPDCDESRYSTFEAMEKDALLPLPEEPYEP